MTLARILFWPLRPVLLLLGLLLGAAGLGNALAGQWPVAILFLGLAGLCWEGRRLLLP